MLYGWSLCPTSMIRSQKFKNFQFLGFFIIWFFLLFLFFKKSSRKFLSLVKWFFGLVFWVGFSGGNFEGANLTRLDSIFDSLWLFFFLSLMMIEEKYYFFIFCILNISRYWRNMDSLSPSTSQGEREILLATGFFKLLHQNLELWFYQKSVWYN